MPSAPGMPHGGSSGLTERRGDGGGVRLSELSWGSGLKGVPTHASVREAAAKGQQRKCRVQSDE